MRAARVNPHEIPAPHLPGAACAGMDPDLWMPRDRRRAAWAIQVCRDQCPVLAECAAYARRWRPAAGVWAGTYYGPSA